MQILSACWAMLGKRFENHRPLCPYCLKVRPAGGASRTALALMKAKRFPARRLAGGRWPASIVSVGLFEKRSNCEGPPSANKKMHLLAVGANLTAPGTCASAPSSWSMVRSAVRPMPPAVPVRRLLTTSGLQVRLRVWRMKGVFVPFPAPGAPPSRMISFGKRSFSFPISSSSSFQTVWKISCASLTSRSVCLGEVETLGGAFSWGMLR